MNGNLVRKLSLCILVALIAAMPATIALASKPTFESLHEEFTEFRVDCGSFDVLEDVVVDWDITTFFDADGNPVTVKFHGDWSGTFFSPETGKSLAYGTPFNAFFDLETNELTFTGVNIVVTLRQEGLLYLDAGRIIITLDDSGGVDEIRFSAGPHPFFTGDWAAICTKLA